MLVTRAAAAVTSHSSRYEHINLDAINPHDITARDLNILSSQHCPGPGGSIVVLEKVPSEGS